MTRFAWLIAFCVFLNACSGNDAIPTVPGTRSPSVTPTVFTLHGTVLGNGAAVSGASVTIMDGIHAGQARDTSNTGHFSFADLTPSAFTLQATATGSYVPENQSVDLTTGNQTVTFTLSDH